MTTLDLWWGIPIQGKKAEYNNNKAVLPLEIDQKDFEKRKDTESFFNYTTSGIDNHFFRVPMLLTVPFHYIGNDDDKVNFILLKNIGKTTLPNMNKISINDLKRCSKTIAQY